MNQDIPIIPAIILVNLGLFDIKLITGILISSSIVSDFHCNLQPPHNLTSLFLPPVWPLPRSLATTDGISVDFSSSPYLDVSVRAVPPVHLWIQCTVTGHDSGRIAPFGYPWISACLRLPMAFRSLLRPSSAPGAKAFPLRSL